MRYLRQITGVGLAMLLMAGAGCNNQTAVLPTDQQAKELASQPPPPIHGLDGTAGATKNATTPAAGATNPPKSSSGLQGKKLHGGSQ